MVIDEREKEDRWLMYDDSEKNDNWWQKMMITDLENDWEKREISVDGGNDDRCKGMMIDVAALVVTISHVVVNGGCSYIFWLAYNASSAYETRITASGLYTVYTPSSYNTYPE